MASSGDEITFTFSGAKETVDISNVDELIIRRMDGASGGASIDPPGSGGRITAANLDISASVSLDLTVGGSGGFSSGGFGRFNGGDGGGGSFDAQGQGGGGSTELLINGNLVAAADAGGGTSDTDFGDGSSAGGGGGARGGSGGDGNDANGQDAGGTGFGGKGARAGNEDAGDGGQELGSATLLPRGETTSGGGSGGEQNGEIVLLFDKPLKPLSLTTAEDTSNVDPTVNLSWTNDAQRTNRIYRSDVDSPAFKSDFVEVGSVGEGTTTFTDSPPDFETTFTYRVTAESVGESAPSTPATITTSGQGGLFVTITDTNSPVTTGETLEIDVEASDADGSNYRAEEDINAVLELQ